MFTYVCSTGPPALTVNIMKNTESSSVVVQWDEVDDSLPTTYTVTWISESDYNIQVKTLEEQSSYTITGLHLDTVYTITVTATNRCGSGPEYSTTITLHTDTTSSIPDTTTTISTSTVNPGSITTTTVTVSKTTTTTIFMLSPSTIAVTTDPMITAVSTGTTGTTTNTATINTDLATTTTAIANNSCMYVSVQVIFISLHAYIHSYIHSKPGFNAS